MLSASLRPRHTLDERLARRRPRLGNLRRDVQGMSNSPISGVTAANLVSGQITAATISFPLTGDPELDAASGFLAVLANANLTASAAVRVVRLILDRQAEALEQGRRLTRLMEGRQGLGATMMEGQCSDDPPLPAAGAPSWFATNLPTEHQISQASSGSAGPSGMLSSDSAGGIPAGTGIPAPDPLPPGP
jgi:hypothetical protein